MAILDKAVEALERSLRIRVISLSDADYQSAHKVYDAVTNRHPRLIALR